MKLKETIMIAIAALAFMLITGIAKANPVVNWFEAEKKKTHIMGIIGDKEVENSEVTIRLRGGNIVGGIKLDKLSDYISSIVNKSRETNLN